jgi:hypothetical protein
MANGNPLHSAAISLAIASSMLLSGTTPFVKAPLLNNSQPSSVDKGLYLQGVFNRPHSFYHIFLASGDYDFASGLSSPNLTPTSFIRSIGLQMSSNTIRNFLLWFLERCIQSHLPFFNIEVSSRFNFSCLAMEACNSLI